MPAHRSLCVARGVVMIGLLLGGVVMNTFGASARGARENLPALPQKIPAAWLARDAHPRMFCSPQEFAQARKLAAETDWGRRYVEEQKKLCARFLTLPPEQLQALIPKPGCLITYGLGMNLDPVEGKRMVWAGWDNPFKVKDQKGTVYPNEQWPDAGDGVADPKTGTRYYFVAMANGRIFQEMESKILPALADVYALTGSQEHARTAAVLFDAIAAVYPTNRRGPLDYPTSPSDYDRGGRLDRPYYQAARGMMNYTTAIDLLAPSGEFDKPSLATREPSIRENLIRNLLWDGGLYCFDFVLEGHQLHNGHADYLRGAAMVGILLGVRDLAQPMFMGPLSMQAMLDTNIDRNGFYHELSPGYANHTRELYFTIAELTEYARRLGWEKVDSAYAQPALRLFCGENFNREEVGGHVPMIGDDGPDRYQYDPLLRTPAKPYVSANPYLQSQIHWAWVRMLRSPDESDRRSAMRLLRDSYGPDALPSFPEGRWAIYHIPLDALRALEAEQPDRSRFETAATFYGAKGLALLRGGSGPKRHGAQLFFGPVHNHGQREALTWVFFAKGAEWSFDAGYFNTHYRFGWTSSTVAHQAMVVNAEEYDWQRGGGHLVAWHAAPDVQFALARHPDAYREQGVTRYERLIAQVQDAPGGDLAYWLDVGLVAGGQTRDDSFHTQMQDMQCSLPLPAPDPARPSLYGDKDFGRMLTDNGRLKGPEFDDKEFYWKPPGAGYGFLGSPREADMTGAARIALTRPAFAADFKGVLVADLLNAPGRRLIAAVSPLMRGTPEVPYLLRRDTGDGLSLFAKVLRVCDDPDRDPIRAVQAVPVEGAAAQGAWLVTWNDGRRDLWIFGDGAQGRVASEGLPPVEFEARIALIRFDAQARVQTIHASAAARIAVQGAPEITGPAVIEGRVKKVIRDESPVRLQATWQKGSDALLGIASGALLLTLPPKGQPVTWQATATGAEDVVLADVKPIMATCEFTRVEGKPGWYALRPGVSRFFSAGGSILTDYVVGRPVYRGERLVGRIGQIAGDGKSLYLESNGKPADAGERFTGPILETSIGDRILIPVETVRHFPR